jgi:hypothetical protein
MITADGRQAAGPGGPVSGGTVSGGTVYGGPDGYAAPGCADIGIPELVVVPAHPAGGHDDVVFETREAPGGQAVLPVFSSVRRLVGTLGHAQPWLAMPLVKVRELAAAGGLPEVVLDPAVQPGAWLWKTDDLKAWLEDGR